MVVTQEAVLAALKNFIDPNTRKDYVSTRAVKNLKVEGGQVSFDVELGYPAKTQIDPIRTACGIGAWAHAGSTAAQHTARSRRRGLGLFIVLRGFWR